MRNLLIVGLGALMSAMPVITVAQVSIHDGSGSDPDDSAMLDVQATDKGVLVPNVDIADLATPAPVTGPAEGLLVWNTNITTGEGYYYWDGSAWVRLMSSANTPTGNGAQNKVAFWATNTSLGNNTNFHWNNTDLRLGIGTSAPANGIHVRNADPTPLYLERTAAANVNIRYTNTGGTLYAGMNPSNGFAIGPNQDLANAATWMTVTTAGNLGIGTTSPTQSRLVVNGTISIPRAESFQFLESITGAFRAGMNSTNSNEAGVGFNALRFYVNANSTTPVMVIGGGINTGNMGVGTTDPIQRLHVAGDVNVSSGQGFRINNTATSGQYLRGDGNRFVSSAIQLGDLPSSGQITVSTTGIGLGVTGSPVALGGTVTITSNATAANTANTIVSRDGSGNFSAGQVNANLNGQWLRIDDRIIEPNSISSGHARFGFTSWNNNNSSPYADFLHLRSYTDASGGSDNLIMLSKSGIAMRVWQQAWNSASPYATYKTVAFIEDLNNFSGLANPSATIGLTAVNGTATTAMRSDAAPALSQAIVPTWTGTHTFNNGTYSAVFTGGNVGVGSATPPHKFYVTGGSGFFATSTNTDPVIIARNYKTTNHEELRMGADDANMYFYYVNDEVTSRLRFRLHNTDTEAGGGANASDNEVLTLYSNNQGGKVGINNVSPTYELHVNGRIRTNAINETSDARLKTDVTDLTDALSKVLAMRGVNYRWRTDEYPEMKLDSTLQFGLIAQELEKVVPELVDTDEQGWKSIEYSHIVPLLIEAMKEQQNLIFEQSNWIKSLKDSNVKFDQRLRVLEARLMGVQDIGQFSENVIINSSNQ